MIPDAKRLCPHLACIVCILASIWTIRTKALCRVSGAQSDFKDSNSFFLNRKKKMKKMKKMKMDIIINLSRITERACDLLDICLDKDVGYRSEPKLLDTPYSSIPLVFTGLFVEHVR